MSIPLPRGPIKHQSLYIVYRRRLLRFERTTTETRFWGMILWSHHRQSPTGQQHSNKRIFAFLAFPPFILVGNWQNRRPTVGGDYHALLHGDKISFQQLTSETDKDGVVQLAAVC